MTSLVFRLKNTNYEQFYAWLNSFADQHKGVYPEDRNHQHWSIVMPHHYKLSDGYGLGFRGVRYRIGGIFFKNSEDRGSDGPVADFDVLEVGNNLKVEVSYLETPALLGYYIPLFMQIVEDWEDSKDAKQILLAELKRLSDKFGAPLPDTFVKYSTTPFVDGNYIGRDKIIYGDVVHGDKIEGNKVTVGNITNSDSVNIAGGGINTTQNPPLPVKPEMEAIMNSKPLTTKKNKTARKSGNKFISHWLPITAIIVAILGVIATVAFPELRQLLGLESGNFSYQVRVQREGSGEIIKDAKVIIEVTGNAPLIGYTDNNGYARIFINESFAGKSGRLRVETTGYEPYWEEIDIDKDSLPDMIRLTPSQ